jgi:hypothetical protein
MRCLRSASLGRPLPASSVVSASGGDDDPSRRAWKVARRLRLSVLAFSSALAAAVCKWPTGSELPAFQRGSVLVRHLVGDVPSRPRRCAADPEHFWYIKRSTYRFKAASTSTPGPPALTKSLPMPTSEKNVRHASTPPALPMLQGNAVALSPLFKAPLA